MVPLTVSTCAAEIYIQITMIAAAYRDQKILLDEKCTRYTTLVTMLFLCINVSLAK